MAADDDNKRDRHFHLGFGRLGAGSTEKEKQQRRRHSKDPLDQDEIFFPDDVAVDKPTMPTTMPTTAPRSTRGHSDPDISSHGSNKIRKDRATIETYSPTLVDEEEDITDDDDDDESASGGDGGGAKIIFHKEKSYKFSALYWRSNFASIIPENGRIKIRANNTLSFKGLLGTHFEFQLGETAVEKSSRMRGLIHDAFIIRKLDQSASHEENETSDEGKEDVEFFFSVVLKNRDKAVRRIQEAINKAIIVKESEKLNSKQQGVHTRGNNQDKAVIVTKPPPPPFRMAGDPTLQKMKIIAKKKLTGVSLKDYYEVAWSEGEHCDKPAMYGPFLTSCAKNNVVVNPWEAGKFNGNWCKESYTQQRFVTFNFMKQTIGQTLVEVKHTQRCRFLSSTDDHAHLDDADRCIVHMSLQMKGFPYAECFVVEVRHVASRIDQNDLEIEIGMTVVFLKSCMFESKIRNNTGAETTKAQVALLERVVEGCQKYAKQAEGEDEVVEEKDHGKEVELYEGKEVVLSDLPQQTKELSSAKTITATDAATKITPQNIMTLPRPIFHFLRGIMLIFVALFRLFLKPIIPLELLHSFPPSTIDDAVQKAKIALEHLDKRILSSDDVSLPLKGKKDDIEMEMMVMKKCLNKIESIVKASNVQ